MNPRPLAPKASALTKLRYIPAVLDNNHYTRYKKHRQVVMTVGRSYRNQLVTIARTGFYPIIPTNEKLDLFFRVFNA